MNRQQVAQEQAAAGASPSGLLADRYRRAEELGAGPAGRVSRARDTLLGRAVAVKELSGLQDDVALGRAVRAARAAARARHPRLVAVLDVATSGRPPLLALQEVQGQRMDQVLAAGTVPPERAVQWAGDVLAALAALHDAGAVHRDVREENVLVAGGRAWLTSAGLTQAARDPQLGLRLGDEPAGGEGGPSPEQQRGGAADARSDVAAAGALLQRILPAAGEPAIAAVLAKATAADPADRHPHAAALRADVLEALGAPSPSGPAPATGEAEPEPSPTTTDEPPVEDRPGAGAGVPVGAAAGAGAGVAAGAAAGAEGEAEAGAGAGAGAEAEAEARGRNGVVGGTGAGVAAEGRNGVAGGTGAGVAAAGQQARPVSPPPVASRIVRTDAPRPPAPAPAPPRPETASSSTADRIAKVVLALSAIAALVLLVITPLLNREPRPLPQPEPAAEEEAAAPGKPTPAAADLPAPEDADPPSPAATPAAVPSAAAPSASPAPTIAADEVAALRAQAAGLGGGADIGDLLDRLENLDDVSGVERDVAMVGLFCDALAHRETQAPDAPVADGIIAVLRPQMSIGALIATIDADPDGPGPGARVFASQLRVLLGLSGEELRVEATNLWIAAQSAGVSGELTSLFAQTAMMVLEDVATPEA